jgi:hypothetical protein
MIIPSGDFEQAINIVNIDLAHNAGEMAINNIIKNTNDIMNT